MPVIGVWLRVINRLNIKGRAFCKGMPGFFVFYTFWAKLLCMQNNLIFF